MTAAKVLVTGASGFIAKHCIAELLRRDYAVRATLRNLARADEVRQSVAHAGADASGVELMAADLLGDEGWAQAMQGCTYVLHIASPFPLAEPKNPDDVIRPAREGALRVLRAAREAGVKRVVMTSSIVAIDLPWPEAPVGHVFTEADWTNPRAARHLHLRQIEDARRACGLGFRQGDGRRARAGGGQSGLRPRPRAR